MSSPRSSCRASIPLCSCSQSEGAEVGPAAWPSPGSRRSSQSSSAAFSRSRFSSCSCMAVSRAFSRSTVRRRSSSAWACTVSCCRRVSASAARVCRTATWDCRSSTWLAVSRSWHSSWAFWDAISLRAGFSPSSDSTSSFSSDVCCWRSATTPFKGSRFATCTSSRALSARTARRELCVSRWALVFTSSWALKIIFSSVSCSSRSTSLRSSDCRWSWSASRASTAFKRSACSFSRSILSRASARHL
mmetsp:Transcript_49351/g.88149  ORF Transcript_49351/g.88149 Transcript_49351/m.88149 type:complete len:246 (+) Transcript_49351:185-922(+)